MSNLCTIKYKEKVIYVFGSGECLALGMSWHLDNGFWNIFIDTFIGWMCVGFKVSQYVWPI